MSSHDGITVRIVDGFAHVHRESDGAYAVVSADDVDEAIDSFGDVKR